MSGRRSSTRAKPVRGLSTGVGASLRPIAEEVATDLIAVLPGNQGTVVTIATEAVRAGFGNKIRLNLNQGVFLSLIWK